MSIKVTYMNCNQFYSCHVTYIFIDGVSYYLFICSVLLILLLREIYSCVSRSEWLFRMTVIHPFIADCAKRALIHIRYLYWIRECFLYVFDFYHVLFRCLDFLFFFWLQHFYMENEYRCLFIFIVLSLWAAILYIFVSHISGPPLYLRHVFDKVQVISKFDVYISFSNAHLSAVAITRCLFINSIN